MFISMAYVVKPKLELIKSVNELNQDLANYFSNTILIVRNDERRIYGAFAEADWVAHRVAEVKNFFVNYLQLDQLDLDHETKEEISRLLGHSDKTDEIFDRWWTIERIEDIITFNSKQN
jgi:hypothetical protein